MVEVWAWCEQPHPIKHKLLQKWRTHSINVSLVGVIPLLCAGESLREASPLMNLLTTTAKTRIGTWNIRTLYESSKATEVAKEMKRYNIMVLGLCETRWNGSGQTRLTSGETIIHSGHEDQDHNHTQGVAIIMTPKATKALMSWEPVSAWLMSARFNSKGRKCTIIQCYAPTNAAEEGNKEHFYSSLQALMDRTPRTHLKIIIGDMNAKVGEANTGKQLIIGTHGIGTCNENGELLTDLCFSASTILSLEIPSFHTRKSIRPLGPHPMERQRTR